MVVDISHLLIFCWKQYAIRFITCMCVSAGWVEAPPTSPFMKLFTTVKVAQRPARKRSSKTEDLWVRDNVVQYHLSIILCILSVTQESNADLPSEYWQIQKLIKYLKVNWEICYTHTYMTDNEFVMMLNCDRVEIRQQLLLPCAQSWTLTSARRRVSLPSVTPMGWTFSSTCWRPTTSNAR